MQTRLIPIFCLCVMLGSLLSGSANAQGRQTMVPGNTDSVVLSAFSYQGRLSTADGPLNDACDLQFFLWSDGEGRTQVGDTLTFTGINVSNGLFSVVLDFGAEHFTGDMRYLSTAVKCTNDAEFTMLHPRQPLYATPYALSVKPGAHIGSNTLYAEVAVRHEEIVNGPVNYYFGVYARADSDYGTGVEGISDVGKGVSGVATEGGIGVFGRSQTGVAVNALGGGDAALIAQNFHGGDALRTLSSNGGEVMFAVGSDGTARTKALQITGGSDLAERFIVQDAADLAPGTLLVIDEAHPGQLKPSTSAYDTKVAGIVSGAGGIQPGLTLHQEGMLEGDATVAIAGRVYVQAEAVSAAIRPGDLLTSSDLPGYVMKATDREQMPGAIIGKAMSELQNGTGLVLVLVNLQ